MATLPPALYALVEATPLAERLRAAEAVGSAVRL